MKRSKTRATLAESGIQQNVIEAMKLLDTQLFTQVKRLEVNIVNTAIEDMVNEVIAGEHISAKTVALQMLGITTREVTQRSTFVS